MVDRTKLAIVAGFNTLITQKDFEDITIQDICREAKVSKATFYRYFKDKYDAMNYNYKQMLDDSLLDESVHNYRDLYFRLYELGETRLRAVQGAFRSTGINSLENFIYTYSRDIVIDITRQNRGGKGLTETERLQLDVFCYGISYMYKHWVAGEYRIGAKRAAEELYAMMPPTLREYWLVDEVRG